MTPVKKLRLETKMTPGIELRLECPYYYIILCDLKTYIFTMLTKKNIQIMIYNVKAKDLAFCTVRKHNDRSLTYIINKYR